jgi:2-polyprenyl-3-methyl-5-hydroxy-6-metoxy-1,4-benzoquinol methylase
MNEDSEESGETNQAVLRPAMMRRLRRRVSGAGAMLLPAVPSLLDHYVEKLLAAFALHERPFNADDAAVLRGHLEHHLTIAWEKSPYSKLLVQFETEAPPKDGINYKIQRQLVSVADEYDSWVETRPKPFFGALPDAKVLHVARSLGEPRSVRVLDVGAAEGRNTLPLAREGFQTDAVELSPKFAELLRTSLSEEQLEGRVFVGDFMDPALGVPEGHYDLVVFAGVLVAHVRDRAHLTAALAAGTKALVPGGVLLFNLFVTAEGFIPDQLTNQLGEVFWTVFFQAEELAQVVSSVGLELVENIPYLDYAKQHQPEFWPPTDYFAEYVDGIDLFDLPPGRPPLRLRWVTCRKS